MYILKFSLMANTVYIGNIKLMGRGCVFRSPDVHEKELSQYKKIFVLIQHMFNNLFVRMRVCIYGAYYTAELKLLN